MYKKIVFVLIIALGIFLRLWQINSLPGGLFVDEINIAVDAKSLAQNGVDQYGRHFPFYFEDDADFKLPGYLYATAAAYKFFGGQIMTVHIPSAIAGILNIFALGFLAKVLFPKKKYLAFFAMGILALSPFAIHFSRIGYETNFALFFLLIYLIALLQVLEEKKTVLWLSVGSIACITANWTYPAPRFIIPLFTLLLLGIFTFLNFPGLSKKAVKRAMIFFIPIGITFIPTIIFPFADLRLLSFIHQQPTKNILTSLATKGLAVIASWVRLYNIEFLFDKGDLFGYRHGTKELGIFLSVFLIPFFVGMWWYIKQVSKQDFRLVFLGIFMLIAGLPSALSYDVPYATRLIPMLIPYSLFIALGITVIGAWLQKQKLFLRTGIYVAFLVVLTYQIGLFSYIYFVHFRQSSIPEFPVAPVAVAQYVAHFHMQYPDRTIYFLSDRECHPWGSDALYLWYFNNLSNTEMIAWNTAYRTERYKEDPTSPFSAYEQKGILQGYIPSYHLYIFPSPATINKALPGSLFVHCGIELTTYNKNNEALQKILYSYPETHRDPYYILTIRR